MQSQVIWNVLKQHVKHSNGTSRCDYHKKISFEKLPMACEREGISFLAYPLLGDINIIRSRKSCTIWLNDNGIYRLC